MHPTVSIVIPVRNEAKGITECLDSWLNQSVAVEEIVVIDSGSTDGTLEIVRGYDKVRLVEIPGSEFNHGTTRNRAMRHVTGELTLMTVGDARACDRSVLARLVAGFDSDRVAGVCGLQVVPHEPDKNPAEWFRPRSEPRTKRFSFETPEQFEALPPGQKRDAASWDDVIAMYRTSVLRDQIPFREIPYGEDPLWAIDALKAGHTLVYDPSARVFHYHLEDEAVTYRRVVTMLCLRNWLFGVVPEIPRQTLRARLSLVRSLLRPAGLSIGRRWHWWCFNLANQKAMRRAIDDFLQALQSGDEEVKRLHDRSVGKPFRLQSLRQNP